MGLSFKSGIPMPIYDGAMVAKEGCAAVSDSAGNLLFYTNGENIWNKSHQIMSNGGGLFGGNSSTQSSLILPDPGSAKRYYVFTTPNGSLSQGLRYSIVDLSFLSGLGAVVSWNKFVFSRCDEKLIACPNADGSGYWILAHESGSNKIRTYELKQSGIDTSVYVVSTGVISSNNTGNFMGGADFSSNGKLVAMVYGSSDKVELFDFNNQTGQLTNPRVIQLPISATFDDNYYTCFSPGSKYLYVSGSRLFQINVSYNDITQINASVKVISSAAHAAMQTGPDMKVYIARLFTKRLSVINEPDKEFPFCKYADTGVVFNSVNRVERGLPNFVKHRASDFTFSSTCYKDTTLFLLLFGESDSAHIDFGDSNSVTVQSKDVNNIKHLYKIDKIYSVKVKFYFGLDSLILIKNVEIRQPPFVYLGNDTSVCFNSYTLSAVSSNQNQFLWSTGSTSFSPKFYSFGQQWIRVFDGYCYNYDTILVTKIEQPFVVNLGRDTIRCEGDAYLLDPGLINATFVWQNGSTQRTFEAKQSNTYWVKVSKVGFDCPVYDTVKVTFYPRPYIQLGQDKYICKGDSIIFDLRKSGYKDIVWQDGSKDSLYIVKKDGLYSVSVKDILCYQVDSIRISTYSTETLIQEQYLVCTGDSVLIDIRPHVDKAIWYDSDTTTSRYFKLSGVFPFQYWKYACLLKDSVRVYVLSTPNDVLPEDTFVCGFSLLELNSKSDDFAKYVWSTGELTSRIQINTPGKYYVTISNQCGELKDTVLVEDCECIFYVPTAFSPNKDNLNDGFKPVGCAPTYYNLKIYSRWGELLFETDDFNQEWRGDFNGKFAGDNTFAWVIEYSGNKISGKANKITQGTVTILR
ncbi:MAG: gliding motility-associated C-terminal domain-containing protein [Bacteroidia bacterium]|nr:gliding motility-associated C-terminal domain-containing protein [Bacteroidia bacterium]MBP9725256.1 gliding motility-associated C-terminal domain-containing protein [Bacteroidia bacterium]